MNDALLILNAGSSSVKFSVFDSPGLGTVVRGQIESLSTAARFRAFNAENRLVADKAWKEGSSLSHGDAIDFLLSWGREDANRGYSIVGAGHRVLHGGLKYDRPVRIDRAVLDSLQTIAPLAPLHQPHNLAAIHAVARLAPGLPQVACFDTAFHRTQPALAQMFAIPRSYTEKGIRRYGFHGLSYEFIASELPRLDPKAAAGRTIVAHLGNGASMCAMVAGRSVATTMGLSALDGLVMSTRCGSIDPGVLIYLASHEHLDMPRIQNLLHAESGLLGVSGLSGDMRTLLASSDPRAKEAIDLFVYRAAREIGSLAAAMNGLDALVFTGGIGEHAAPVRAAICEASRWLGVELDTPANVRHGTRISAPTSRVSAWAIPTNEELMIARHTLATLTTHS